MDCKLEERKLQSTHSNNLGDLLPVYPSSSHSPESPMTRSLTRWSYCVVEYIPTLQHERAREEQSSFWRFSAACFFLSPAKTTKTFPFSPFPFVGLFHDAQITNTSWFDIACPGFVTRGLNSGETKQSEECIKCEPPPTRYVS